MSDPAQTPPAATPAANQPIPGGQQPPSPADTVKTQVEIDAIVEDRLKRDREAREKDLGVSLKEAKTLIAAAKKMEEDKKTELEKLQGINQTLESDNKAIKSELLKLRLAIEAQIPADKLPKVLKYVTGSTDVEIKASLAEVKADWGLDPQTPPIGAQGAGNPGVPSPNNPKKIWTEQEIKELRLNGGLTDTIMEDIRKATLEGRIQ